jgi:uncharacterized protein (DUF2147 family)
MRITVLAGLAAVAFIASENPGACSPLGNWLAKDGATIRISSCGQNMCGFMAKPNPPNDPDTNRPWTDKNNIDPAKRSRRLAGAQILIGMKPKGSKTWSGRLYNSDDGKTYAGNLIELEDARIRIEGCAFGICGGEELTRLK